MQAGDGKLLGNLVGTGNAHKIGFGESVSAGHGKCESAAGFQVGNGFVVLFEVQGDHIFCTDSAPGHCHGIYGLIFIVGDDHVCRHGEQERMHTKIFFHNRILSDFLRAYGFLQAGCCNFP